MDSRAAPDRSRIGHGSSPSVAAVVGEGVDRDPEVRPTERPVLARGRRFTAPEVAGVLLGLDRRGGSARHGGHGIGMTMSWTTWSCPSSARSTV
jgi:hypothetical protein